ncbi:MAG: major facilitator superfamily transporter [Rhodobacteraceae bacterium]|uniref:MFS transporter n=1 Tax=Cypionkella sp. TaxID=2811411 RepID=UPI0013211AA1|nr:MFS transporter [Cypionkella sp.]KAF0171292.1 MAG: major facilitator superfamily transporter [Paracoccaceae bacterium]MDO8327040.1 MFS transporter [Cypionkella sp.]
MLKVLAHSWPLLLGVMLLMVGNGVQGSLLGIRGALEGFTTFQLSVVMSAYFLGFLGGSRLAPAMIRRVGHVRVFSALGSMISAVLVLYPLLLDWTAWALMRVLIGFCFSGIYVTAESWLNNTASNETRGQALSAYMIVQMLGIIASQGLLAMGDPSGFGLFIIPSVLVSLAFMPILLADTPAPTFDSIKAMSFRQLFVISPLGCAGMLLTGGVFSAMFGMASVYGAMSAMTIAQIAIFVAAMYVGGLVLQYPIGWLSDRIDRRALILWMSAAGAVVMGVAAALPLPFVFEVVVAALLGGIINPLYSLLIAHTNDYLGKEEMPGASAGLIFLNGFGAIFGPLVAGWLMGEIGPKGYFLIIGGFFAVLAGYAAYRMTRRAAPVQSGGYTGLSPTASSLAVEAVLSDEPRR